MGSNASCEVCGQALRPVPGQDGRDLRCPACQAPLAAEPGGLSGGSRRSFWLILAPVGLSLAAAVAWVSWPPPVEPPSPQQRLTIRGVPLPPERVGDRGPAPPPKGPAGPIEESLTIPRDTNFRLAVSPAAASYGGALVPAGQVPPAEALACAAYDDLLLTTGVDGELRWLDAATLRPRGQCPLPGVAYALVCDPSRHRLYAALAAPESLQVSLLGDRYAARGDVYVFDLDEILRRPGAAARPLRRLALAAQVWGIHLDSDGAFSCLVETERAARLVRFGPRPGARPQELPVAGGGSHSLVASAGGDTLFVLSGGRLLAVDAAAWKAKWTRRVGANIQQAALGPGGRIVLVEYRSSLFLVLFDPRTGAIDSRTALGIEGRPYLASSRDGRRLFVGTSAVTSGEVLAVDFPASAPFRPRLAGWARSDRDHLIRGGICLGGDGRFLLTGSGLLLRVGQ